MNTAADTTPRPAADTASAGAVHIEASGLVRAFGPVQALGPVDLRMRAGEFVSVVGPSGCGKSTLLEIVGGLQAPDAGTVEVGGETLAGPRDRTAIVFQDSASLPWRTVLDNVAFPLEVARVPREERRARGRELLGVVGLADFAGHHPHQLSGGMRQRVAIARALIMEPDLILADEPFGALDEQTRTLMAFELLAVVERLSASVLFITHSIQEAVLLSDRILVMSARPGRVLDEVVLDLPRPRAQNTLALPEATAAVERIWTTLRAEASASMREPG